MFSRSAVVPLGSLNENHNKYNNDDDIVDVVEVDSDVNLVGTVAVINNNSLLVDTDVNNNNNSSDGIRNGVSYQSSSEQSLDELNIATTTPSFSPTSSTLRKKMDFSQIPGNPEFRNAAVNVVAVVPLLSSTTSESTKSNSHSTVAFYDLMNALRRHHYFSTSSSSSNSSSTASDSSELLLVVPNSHLTRPGDWRYNDTPLTSFHWQHGCQRMSVIDGRPNSTSSNSPHTTSVTNNNGNRQSHDRLFNSSIKQDWIDLIPYRRTSAVIGVISMQDCVTLSDFYRAEEELHLWASQQYAQHPYAAHLYGSTNYVRDVPIERLFVYDSFTSDLDLSPSIAKSACTISGNKIVPFPPPVMVDDMNHATNIHVMNLHLNVVLNDLAVAIFRDLENKLRYYNPEQEQQQQQSTTSKKSRTNNTLDVSQRGNDTNSMDASISKHSVARRTLQRYISFPSSDNSISDTVVVPPETVLQGTTMDNNTVDSDIPPGTSLLGSTTTITSSSGDTVAPTTITSGTEVGNNSSSHGGKKILRLVTPLDVVQQETTSFNAKEIETNRRRDVGRREKWCGDISLLAGSPLDAYGHYLKAAEIFGNGTSGSGGSDRTGGGGGNTTSAGSGTANTVSGNSLDPLWHASALEGCAAAHISMADGGGYNVDEYLENNFQLPDEVTTLLIDTIQSNNNNSNVTLPKRHSNKQTLPEVVFTLCTEAIRIYQRDPLLAHLFAELLLKLAKYCADGAEGHLRCQWGKGHGCYSGLTSDDIQLQVLDDTNNRPRWMRTTACQLLTLVLAPSSSYNDDNSHPMMSTTRPLPTGMLDMAMMNTVHRTKKVGELLHNAVAIGALDPATRVDVAYQSTTLALKGIKPTNWRGVPVAKIQLQRKAAYFATVAAEAVNLIETNTLRSQELWLLATQLYARDVNPPDGGGRYGWASLRAHCLEALATQGTSRIALESSLQLLSLLSDLQPIEITNQKSTASVLVKEKDDEENLAHAVTPKKKNSAKKDNTTTARQNLKSNNNSMDGLDDGGTSGSANVGDVTESQEPPISSTQPITRKTLRETVRFKTAASNPAEGNIIPSVSTPFSELASLPSALHNLKGVWPFAESATCVQAQQHCLERIVTLRRSLPTGTTGNCEDQQDFCSIYDVEATKLPLYITSVTAIQSDPALELECVKKVTKLDKSKEGAMATFFNPYEAKKKNSSHSTIRVAEEEERGLRIVFANKLALPLEVQRCQLEFDNNFEGRVKAATLSFVIPAKATSFAVHFPFTVSSKVTRTAGDGHDENSSIFEVKGLDLTCCGRSFFIPIEVMGDATVCTESMNLPESLSVYPYKPAKKPVVVEADMKPRIETFPCQPRLHVTFADSGAPVDNYSIGLSEGEIYTIPAFRLENYKGPSGMGTIKRLQIFSANVPGVSDKTLYDTDSGDVADVSESDFVKDLMWKENLPPLKLRVLVGSLQLSSINDPDAVGDDTTVSFQIAASHNMGEKLPKGTTVMIRFRYRGLSNSLTEVWRKKEVSLHIRHSKGPRISSIAFRPDLAVESYLAEMAQCAPVPKPTKGTKKFASTINEDAFICPVLHRLGLDNEISVCSDKAHFVLTVANETRSVVSLDRVDDALTGGFDKCLTESITVRPGVSAKIPFVINRIPRCDANGEPTDVISELLSRTNLVWKSHRGGEAGPVKARGNIRVPPACLKDIILRQPSFLTQVCEPPCHLDLFVGNPVTVGSKIEVTLGMPVDVKLEGTLASWIPKDLIDKCTFTIEFRCGRILRLGAVPTTDSSPSSDFFWAGKIRQSMNLGATTSSTSTTMLLKHRARIAFCSPGQYAVSACIKISRNHSTGEEVWWAPTAQTIIVPESKYPVQ